MLTTSSAIRVEVVLLEAAVRYVVDGERYGVVPRGGFEVEAPFLSGTRLDIDPVLHHLSCETGLMSCNINENLHYLSNNIGWG